MLRVAVFTCAVLFSASVVGSTELEFELPPSVEWVLAIDETDGEEFSRTWIPSTESLESASWRITYAKRSMPAKFSAKKYLAAAMKPDRKQCAHAEIFGPAKRPVEDSMAYWGPSPEH